jgi:hypothetical protein
MLQVAALEAHQALELLLPQLVGVVVHKVQTLVLGGLVVWVLLEL